MVYKYLGDRLTDPALKGQNMWSCKAPGWQMYPGKEWEYAGEVWGWEEGCGDWKTTKETKIQFNPLLNFFLVIKYMLNSFYSIYGTLFIILGKC